jgi:hypothetical protein
LNPGGFAATGSSAAAALDEFRRSYTAILFDIAEGASTFQQFEDEVNRFFRGSAETVEREWEEAVEDVREGRVSAEWLAHQPAESPRSIRVARVDQPSAENNEVETGTALAA